jgi:hypothetical protein
MGQRINSVSSVLTAFVVFGVVAARAEGQEHNCDNDVELVSGSWISGGDGVDHGQPWHEGDKADKDHPAGHLDLIEGEVIKIWRDPRFPEAIMAVQEDDKPAIVGKDGSGQLPPTNEAVTIKRGRVVFLWKRVDGHTSLVGIHSP